MLRRILIANRGEIALRIMRACRELDIETVAVYSEADKDSLHLRYADETVCIGPSQSSESYLNIPALIAAAEISDVDAIHPGYGFLSENAHFVEVCHSCNIKFIGPSAETIATAGDKVAAIDMARRAGVPTVPGSGGPVEEEEAVETTDGFLGLVDAVETGAAEESLVEVAGDELAGLEFLFHRFAGVPKLELVESGALGRGGVGGELRGIDLATHPDLVVGMELGHGEGEDASVSPLEGDAHSVAGEELRAEGLGARRIAPRSHGRGGGKRAEDTNKEEEDSHGAGGG